MNRIVETFESKLTVEDINKAPGILSTVKGPFMEIGNCNRNGRLYSKSLVQNKIIDNPDVQEKIKSKLLLGEPGHPMDRDEVDISKASHNITKLWVDEDTNTLMGEADILDTPEGRIINTLVSYGSSIGISARATGSTYPDGNTEVVDEETYELETFDFVILPGFGSARLHESSKKSLIKDLETLFKQAPTSQKKQYADVIKLTDSPYKERLLESLTKSVSTVGTDPIIEAYRKQLLVQASISKTLNSNLDKYKSINKELKEDIDLSNEYIDTLEENYLNEQASKQNLDVRLKRLRSELESQQVEILEAIDKVNSCNDKNNSLLEDNKSLKRQVNSLMRINEELTKTNKDLILEKKTLQRSNNMLQDSIKNFKDNIRLNESKMREESRLLESKFIDTVVNDYCRNNSLKTTDVQPMITSVKDLSNLDTLTHHLRVQPKSKIIVESVNALDTDEQLVRKLKRIL